MVAVPGTPARGHRVAGAILLASLACPGSTALPHVRTPLAGLRARVRLGGPADGSGLVPPAGSGGRGRGGGGGDRGRGRGGGGDDEGLSPIVLKSLSMGITYSLADAAAQLYTRGAEPMSLLERLRRNVGLSLVGLLWVGPLLTVWFDWLAKVVPGGSAGPAIVRTLIDQLLEAPFMIASIFFFSALAEGHDLPYAAARVRRKLLSTWSGCSYVWVPVQLINQGLVPLHLRVYFQSFVSFFWDAYMSVAAHG